MYQVLVSVGNNPLRNSINRFFIYVAPTTLSNKSSFSASTNLIIPISRNYLERSILYSIFNLLTSSISSSEKVFVGMCSSTLFFSILWIICNITSECYSLSHLSRLSRTVSSPDPIQRTSLLPSITKPSWCISLTTYSIALNSAMFSHSVCLSWCTDIFGYW